MRNPEKLLLAAGILVAIVCQMSFLLWNHAASSKRTSYADDSATTYR